MSSRYGALFVFSESFQTNLFVTHVIEVIRAQLCEVLQLELFKMIYVHWHTFHNCMDAYGSIQINTFVLT